MPRSRLDTRLHWLFGRRAAMGEPVLTASRDRPTRLSLPPSGPVGLRPFASLPEVVAPAIATGFPPPAGTCDGVP
jgi:hypothetical protein